ncbi:HU domain-containing protein [Tenacibaculum haliotis]|uniref:HU domain-containing protein n=1 Tax=Tenacibaculum haliotis TaxID=1888914 RepID=UPI0021AE36BE|nr:SPOR domain-containing protein [Tenacibaculum haliotis]MCT4698449.1 SPOR domain-containing protein [Tenacibaculum haliotis]
MTLANYINDLLYRYDCVIVPNFGGFVTNKIGAKMNDATQTFYPPKKQITFNSYLQHNDGLLANYIASSKKISFEEATTFIANEVAEWKKKLAATSVEVASVGTLSLNEAAQIVFEPNVASNFLIASFGLSEIESTSVTRYKQEVKPLPVVSQEKESNTPVFFKYAAAAAVLVGITYAGWNGIQNQSQKEFLANQQETATKKIQSATFVIDNPLPSINLNVTKAKNFNFHIVAGAFQEVKNAENKLAELQQLGYDAKIIGKNKFGLIQVTYSSFSSKDEARKALISIQESVSADAWLLIK